MRLPNMSGGWGMHRGLPPRWRVAWPEVSAGGGVTSTAAQDFSAENSGLTKVVTSALLCRAHYGRAFRRVASRE